MRKKEGNLESLGHENLQGKKSCAFKTIKNGEKEDKNGLTQVSKPFRASHKFKRVANKTHQISAHM